MALSLEAVVSLNRTGFDSALSGMTSIVSDAAGAMAFAFGSVTGELYTMAAAFGPIGLAVAVLKEATEVGQEFEYSMAKVSSVTALVGEELDAVGDLARDFAQETSFSAAEAAEALYGLASAGFSAADQLSNILAPALKLAGATQSEVEVSTETLSATMNAFRLNTEDATRVADLFIGAINASPATMERLNESMSQAAPTAAAFGVSLENTIESLASFETVGIAGSEAGTAFRQAMIALNEQMTKGTSEIGQALATWAPEVTGLTGAIKLLEDAGISGADAMTELGVRGGSAVSAQLALGSAAISELGNKIETTGDVAAAFAVQMDTVHSQWQVFINMMTEVGLLIWEQMEDAVMSAIGVLQSMAQEMQYLVNVFDQHGLIIALETLWDDAMSILPSILAVFQSWGASLVTYFTTTLPNQIGGGDWSTAFLMVELRIHEALLDLWPVIVSAINDGAEIVGDAWESLSAFAAEIDWSTLIGQAADVAGASFALFTAVIVEAIESAMLASQAAWETFGQILSQIDWVSLIHSGLSGLFTAIEQVWDTIVPLVAAGMASIGSVFAALGDILQNIDWVGIGEWLATMLMTIVNDIGDWLQTDGAGQIAHAVGVFFGSIAAVVTTLIAELFSFSGEQIEAGDNSIMGSLANLFAGVYSLGVELMTGLIDGFLGQGMTEMWAGGFAIFFLNIAAIVTDAISQTFNDMIDFLRDGIVRTIDGLAIMADEIGLRDIRDKFEEMSEAVSAALENIYFPDLGTAKINEVIAEIEAGLVALYDESAKTSEEMSTMFDEPEKESKSFTERIDDVLESLGMTASGSATTTSLMDKLKESLGGIASDTPKTTNAMDDLSTAFKGLDISGITGATSEMDKLTESATKTRDIFKEVFEFSAPSGDDFFGSTDDAETLDPGATNIAGTTSTDVSTRIANALESLVGMKGVLWI